MTAIIDKEMLWRQYGTAIDTCATLCATARMSSGKRGCGKTSRPVGSRRLSRRSGTWATIRSSGWTCTSPGRKKALRRPRRLTWWRWSQARSCRGPMRARAASLPGILPPKVRGDDLRSVKRASVPLVPVRLGGSALAELQLYTCATCRSTVRSCSCSWDSRRASRPAGHPRLRLSRPADLYSTMSSSRDRVHHFRGSPYQVGLAAGRTFGARLGQTIDCYIGGREYAGDMAKLHQGALPWLRSLPKRFQEELEGMAEGAGLPLQRLAEWSYIEECEPKGCSAAAGLFDGRAWIARNNDSFVPELWGYASIREVEGRIPTITFSMEGDVFAPTGINRDRLWLHYNFLAAWDEPEPARPHMPGYVFLTEALEVCRSMGTWTPCCTRFIVTAA